MHLLVLSAFRHEMQARKVQRPWFQCTFWCSVLSDPVESELDKSKFEFQCTFWCSVLSDCRSELAQQVGGSGFNAPSGAQCFPTVRRPRSSGTVYFLFQCTFWCSVLSDVRTSTPTPWAARVSMHLLVLSAFRLDGGSQGVHVCTSFNAPSGAQCFPTPPPENRATTPFTGTKSPPTWKAPHRIGSHLSN